MLRRPFILLAPLILLCTPTAVLALGPYIVTDLGTLGGTSSYGTAINDAGHAVGYSTLAGGQTRAFIWTPGGGMQNLGALGSGDSQALDINNNDNVVGVTSNQAFRWTSPGGMILLDSANNGKASGLNNSDAAIGERNLTSVDRTIKWDGSNTLSSPFPLSNSRGAALNDLGQLVVQSGSAGAYNNGVNSTLTPLPLIPTDLNNSRFITGSTGEIASVLDFDSNVFTSLGKLSPTDSFSNALGINAAGTIVGVSQGSGGFVADATYTSIISLTSLLDTGFAGWTILSADDVNSAGQIIGVGQFNGVTHAVILTPVPEPTSCLLVLSGALLVPLLRKNRQRSNRT